MLTDEKKREVVEKLKQLKKEISELRDSLNKLNLEKEEFFKKKENLKKKISEAITGVKGIKKKKDESITELYKLKDKKNEYSSNLRNYINDLKTLNKEKRELLNKFKINPLELKKKIEKLEESLEIEAFKFDTEKKVVKKIKELKQKEKEASKIYEITDKIAKINKDTDNTRDELNKINERIKSLLKEGDYSDFIAGSKEVNELRGEYNAASKGYFSKKDEFFTIGKLLYDKLNELKLLQQALDDNRREAEKIIKENRKNELIIRVKLVEEKIRSKKKLTTEDLLAYREVNYG